MDLKKNSILHITAIMLLILHGSVFSDKVFSSATETDSTVKSGDSVCSEHQLPTEQCFICNPGLREPGRLWCNEHDRYEDRCFICRPESREEGRLWCEEHKLYEDECFLCHPELLEVDSQRTFPSKQLQCVEHGVLEVECGICHPELFDTLLIGQGLKVRLASPDAARKAGIITAMPTSDRPLASLVVLGKVTYNLNSFARITPLAAGIIRNVLVDVGDPISDGQVLAELVSPDLARAISEYTGALATLALKRIVYTREKKLVEKRISSQNEFEQALAEYRVAKSIKDAARQQLLMYGLPEEQIRGLEESESRYSYLSIFAPFSGTLVSRNAVVGETVKQGETIFELADISSMWIELSVPEDMVSLVKVTDPIEASFDTLPGVTIRGRVDWLSSSIDERTRMMKARVVLPNTASQLKAGMFGQIRILSAGPSNVLFAPGDALHRFNEKNFVFVKLSDDLYEARIINGSKKDGGVLEILQGVVPNEELVVNHSFTLKSEFLKSRLGAGCVDE